ncbi:MAG: carbohydrate kinase [Bacteroidetes bacterium]|nr:MAG: carbohydrate kinase [Bacteroidota bacterium]
MYPELFQSFKNINVAVVGDVMLDTYWWGKTDRISPEAPVPVVALQRKEYRMGGAANVALNLIGLGAGVSMHTVTGADDDGHLLAQMMKDKGIGIDGVWKNGDRITTNKIRIISRNQHMMRLDKEMDTALATDDEARFILDTIDRFEQKRPAVVIFEDYNKGVLTPNVIARLIEWCRHNHIVTAVDPKRKNFFAYRGVDIFKPNLKESREALNLIEAGHSLSALQQIHALLHQSLQHRISLITLSEHGVFYQTDSQSAVLPAHLRSIADVSGAGDTVIAVASLVYAATKNVKLTAQIANLAGGLVCEEVGTVAIDAQKLLQECQTLPSP